MILRKRFTRKSLWSPPGLGRDMRFCSFAHITEYTYYPLARRMPSRFLLHHLLKDLADR